MRWLIALGLAVAACSGSGSDGPSSTSDDAGAGGEHASASGSGGKPGAAGSASRAGAPAHAGEGAGAGGSEEDVGSSGNGGAGGNDTNPVAGQGGELVTAGGGDAGGGGSGSLPIGLSGAGGDSPHPKPDPCEGVLPWDPTVPYTEIEKDELRTLRGELWKCSSPAFCTTHPGHETAPGWKKVDDCADPNEGGDPACQCEEGACCDGCFFRPRAFFCGETLRISECSGPQIPACGGGSRYLNREWWNLFCSGDTGGDCSRWGGTSPVKSATTDCPDAGAGCVESGDNASCVACPN